MQYRACWGRAALRKQLEDDDANRRSHDEVKRMNVQCLVCRDAQIQAAEAKAKAKEDEQVDLVSQRREKKFLEEQVQALTSGSHCIAVLFGCAS